MTGARAWPLGVVSQYSLYIMTGGRLVSEACHDTNDCIVTRGRLWLLGVSRDRPRHGAWCSTIWPRKPRHCQPKRARACSDSATIEPRGLATLPVLGLRYGTLHATTQRSACATWVHRARSQGPLGVHLMHPTQL